MTDTSTGLTNQGMEETGYPVDLDAIPSFLLSHVVHLYHQTLQSRLRSAGLSPLKMRIIIALKFRERLTVGELCNFAIAEQPTMSRALDSLERQGLVRRRQSEADSRLRVISLTDSGNRQFERIYPEVQRLNRAMTDGLSPLAKAEFSAQLKMAMANLHRC
ncbi:MAG: MarR family winged helix-turn-helix transcriptional regulator [Paracoccus sp. (in: a-proteobacteria)]